jgi:ribosomal protein S6--L-glutamate ligase
LLVVRQFESMGVSVVNDSNAILNSRNKFRALQACSMRGIDMPTATMVRSHSDLPAAMRFIGQFPRVLKLLQGAQGIGVMIGHDKSAVESVLATILNFDTDIFLQQFVKESGGTDVRVLVIGGKVVAAMRRRAQKGEFRLYVHRGGWG